MTRREQNIFGCFFRSRLPRKRAAFLLLLAAACAIQAGCSGGSSSSSNPGSGGCTYEPLASNGVVFVRTYNSDTRFPTLGSYVNLFNTYVMP